MQKSQANGRISNDDHHVPQQFFREETPSSYAQGFSAGFEAGRRSALAEGTNSHRMTSPTGQRYNGGVSHPAAPSRPVVNHPKTTPPRRTSTGFQHRQSFERPMRNRNDENSPSPTTMTSNSYQHEHEVEGEISTPETPVKFNTRGHY